MFDSSLKHLQINCSKITKVQVDWKQENHTDRIMSHVILIPSGLGPNSRKIGQYCKAPHTTAKEGQKPIWSVFGNTTLPSFYVLKF